MLIRKFFKLRPLLGSFLLVGFVFGYWHWMAYEHFMSQPVQWTSNEPMVVAPGKGINQLASQWQRQGVISNQYYLRLFCALNPQFKQVKAGEYAISKSDTPLTLLEKISLGQVIQYPFTIVEGVNSYQLIQQLQTIKNLKIDFDLEPVQLLKQLQIESQNIEGWLYPDTYYYSSGDSGLAILKRAGQKMQEVLDEEWQNRALELPYDSPYQALIMASIIEKETAIADEREKIAGVFVRRLKRNMRLQTDPTVIYGIGPGFNGDITFRDLRTLTPYNTYKIKGLPPTPIAMPGRASIHAALHPDDGEAIYFVATGDGGHYFSATLEEHNLAKARMLKRQKSDNKTN